jgi:periplasmic divalent cation tolerance protein
LWPSFFLIFRGLPTLRQGKQVQRTPGANKIIATPAKYCSVEHRFATEWKGAPRERVTGLEDSLSDKLVVLVTCTSASQARRIARAVVEARLAACVNILPGAVTSIYRWKGKVESAKERLLLIKTSKKKLAKLQSAVDRLHSYDVPEFIALPIAAGSAAYLEWIGENL